MDRRERGMAGFLFPESDSEIMLHTDPEDKEIPVIDLTWFGGEPGYGEP